MVNSGEREIKNEHCCYGSSFCTVAKICGCKEKNSHLLIVIIVFVSIRDTDENDKNTIQREMIHKNRNGRIDYSK
jgi:hypothetical protein